MGQTAGRATDATHATDAMRQLLADSLDSIPDAILVVDGTGVVELVNAGALRLLQAAGVAQAAGLDLRQLAARMLPPDAQQHIDEQLDGANLPGALEFTSNDGRAASLRMTARTGTGAGWIVRLADVHRARETRRQLDDALRFMAHDMRSPQSSIASLLELRRRGAAIAQDTSSLLERIHRYARTALDISEDYVQLAHAESGDYDFQPEDLFLLMGDAADQLWTRARERGITIALPEDPPAVPCEADRSLMTRAFVNLLENAVRFSPDGSTIQVGITSLAREAGEARGWWQVAVRDHGPQIPAAEMEILFEKFRRASGNEHSRVQGAGFGLALVRSVVLMHGGTVHAINPPQGGAELQLRIPAEQPREQVGIPSRNHEQVLPR